MGLNSKICCFTGHRTIKENTTAMRAKLKQLIINLIEREGFQEFYAGGALGFDKIASDTVIDIRRDYPVRLTLVLPCKDQDKYWNIGQKIDYEHLKIIADNIIYLNENYVKGCMLQRNRYMVDNSQKCVCYLKDYRGGTAYTVRYAAKKGIPVINLATLL